MSFVDLAKRRYSARKYLDKPVEKEKLLKVLEAGRIAPSAANYQPWHFIVLQEKKNRMEFAECYRGDFLKHAPVIIVICGDHNKVWKRRYDGKDHCDVDISIAVDHMTLAATDLGLGTCWICAFEPEKCKEILKLPSHIEPIVVLPMGYPSDEADSNRHDMKRLKLEEIVHWERY